LKKISQIISNQDLRSSYPWVSSGLVEDIKRALQIAIDNNLPRPSIFQGGEGEVFRLEWLNATNHSVILFYSKNKIETYNVNLISDIISKKHNSIEDAISFVDKDN